MVPNPKTFSSVGLMRENFLSAPKSLDVNNNRLQLPVATPSRQRRLAPNGQSAIELSTFSCSNRSSPSAERLSLGSNEHLTNSLVNSDCGSSNASNRKVFNFKILVIGEMAAGKSSFIRKLSQTKKTPRQPKDYYKATIGIEFKSKLIEWDLETLVNVELWDIGGQENCVQMSNVFFRDALGAILMFDASSKFSFDAVLKWKQSLDASVQLRDNSPIPCVLLANKCDLEAAGHSWLMPDKLEQFCKDNSILTYFYTSVKKNLNLEVVLYCLVQEILNRYQKQEYKMFVSDKKEKKKFSCVNCSLM